ncbi:hypothetical protein HJC10_41635 [Corallococcus exiguus]|nr:CapA family protein [Corallococcus exiguus]RKH75618.1 hypothetical protein D7X99_37645 [Corallococcus sp. AB032C]NNB92081.1 hypothetical protein [Corallococcus exiguus]NNC00417.1 hypothetical protein [Corallococcus exiguus]NNC09305.1 hypothetical protein [Corallococcus exiguus]NPC53408.1 hypothetical protein [Corallococcus exiguus]
MSILAVGDVFVDRDDPATAFHSAGGVLRSGDVVFGNCEGVFSDDIQRAPSAGSTLTAPAANAAPLAKAGLERGDGLRGARRVLLLQVGPGLLLERGDAAGLRLLLVRGERVPRHDLVRGLRVELHAEAGHTGEEGLVSAVALDQHHVVTAAVAGDVVHSARVLSHGALQGDAVVVGVGAAHADQGFVRRARLQREDLHALTVRASVDLARRHFQGPRRRRRQDRRQRERGCKGTGHG